MQKNLLPKDGEVYLTEGFFSSSEETRLFTALKQQIAWRQEPIKIMGKEIMQPRLTALYGDAHKMYSYSGITMKPAPWLEELIFIKERVEAFLEREFSTVLLNYYRNGADSMGWHRDNEKSLGKNPTIASVSFGATRPFLLRHYDDPKLQVKIDLPPGSLLIMKGTTQHNWQHSLPKRPQLQEARINLTFRAVAEK
ncbi:alpha-ketoglutarate-dependent dioxygenase AlkB [Olivibacter sp. XZL3]|uniref:alpha-ketoglutarate-dependent dioxygenase AlkB family protein n=1 Tax=Olivibacter sp. XZL3 TaxID=1735116 RepID=UPI001064A820|nr:alpha-ketoglutarate-dependent dioxygenase AlkB [Olivibacter sp. XZL3]